METARNLLNLAMDLSIGDLGALEILISSLMSKGEISNGTVCTSIVSLCSLVISYNFAKK